MKKTKSFIFMLVLIISSALFYSCTEYVENIGKKDIKFVPKTEKYGSYTFVIPANFKLKEESSFIYENNGIVRAYLVYTGLGDKKKLEKFFDEYLSEQGWRKITSLYGDVVVLGYERGSQLLLMKIDKSLNLNIVKIMLTKK
ncbi:MAG: hypothetical protein DSY47_00440 [Hydrogenothermus sp.]|nr:MAG: hypothetical protein DSY47_00440 [Hydrogenothermus sp.]